jgi:hypothetical protein
MPRAGIAEPSEKLRLLEKSVTTGFAATAALIAEEIAATLAANDCVSRDDRDGCLDWEEVRRGPE